MTQPYGQQPPPGEPPYGESQYGQAPYGQSQYGQPPGQPTYARPAAPGTRFHAVVAVLGLIAAVLGVLAVTVLGWFRNDFGSISGGAQASKSSTFGKLHDALHNAQDQIGSFPQVSKYFHFGLSTTYFQWLGYVLIAAAVVLTLLAAAPIGAAVTVVRVLAALAALAGLGLTLWAIDLIQVDDNLPKQFSSGAKAPGYFDYIKHTSFGAWAMGLAFLLCLIAALLPAKRAATTRY